MRSHKKAYDLVEVVEVEEIFDECPEGYARDPETGECVSNDNISNDNIYNEFCEEGDCARPPLVIDNGVGTSSKEEGSSKPPVESIESTSEGYGSRPSFISSGDPDWRRYGGALPKAQFGEDVADIDWGDGPNEFQKKISDKDITKGMNRFYKSPFMGKNKDQSIMEQALQDTKEKHGEDATIENFQIGKTRFNPLRSKTSWTGTTTVPTEEKEWDEKGMFKDVDVSGESKAWRALAPELKK